jgi:hypothetical protein
VVSASTHVAAPVHRQPRSLVRYRRGLDRQLPQALFGQLRRHRRALVRLARTHFDLEKARSLAADQSSDHVNAKVEQTLLEYARYPANIVRTKADAW